MDALIADVAGNSHFARAHQQLAEPERAEITGLPARPHDFMHRHITIGSIR